MSKTISEDVMELVKPALDKRIGELVEAAFKLAQFSGSPDALEKAIDRCSSQYFGAPGEKKGTEEDLDKFMANIDEEADALIRTPRNIIVKRSTTDDRSTAPDITRVKSSRHKNRSYTPGALVKAAKYSSEGRPVSQYQGVSYSGSMANPWVVRYRGKRRGSYPSEVKAASIYDAYLLKDGKSPVNFSEQG